VTRVGPVEAGAACQATDDAGRAAAGDLGAFERLYLRHAARVHRLAARVLGPDDAADATQEVFVRAWSKIGQFRGDSAFGTWLFRLALNAIVRRARHGHRLASAPQAPSEPARPASHDIRLDVARALAGLDKSMRAVVVLHDMEGYSHDEIAQLLGITPSASRMRLHRARSIRRRVLPRR
jgi:RNA polymerase sigma factor (sigma-70 family)